MDATLQAQLAKLIESMGYEFVGCELLPQGRQMLFRIYIDSSKGVTIDDCSKVSHQVSAMLDVQDPIRGKYTLEISSPGIDRSLFDMGHFQKYIGSEVRIRLTKPLNQRRQYKGILRRVEGEMIILFLEETNQELSLLFSAIEKANLIGDIRLKH